MQRLYNPWNNDATPWILVVLHGALGSRLTVRAQSYRNVPAQGPGSLLFPG